jgi:hypothetical protein
LPADYNISPFKDAAVGNTPPVIHLFDEKAPGIQGPLSSVATAVAKTATVASGLALPVWIQDDAKYTSGTNAPLRNVPAPATITWSQFRGPAEVTFDHAKPKLEVLAGGGWVSRSPARRR